MSGPTTDQVREQLRAVSLPGFYQDIVTAGFFEEIDARSRSRSRSVRAGAEMRTYRTDKTATIAKGIRQAVSSLPGVERVEIRRIEFEVALIPEMGRNPGSVWGESGRGRAAGAPCDEGGTKVDRVSGMKRRALLSVSLLHIFLGLFLAHSQAATAAASEQEGEKLFTEKCTACHTIGKGKLIGPDLSGVTTRREESWIKRQIKEPDRMIAEKDPIVMELLKESNNVPMVPLGLSDAEIEAVVAYLKSTEQQASVTTGLPSQYTPTVLISMVVLIGLTWIGLRAGSKKVDVR